MRRALMIAISVGCSGHASGVAPSSGDAPAASAGDGAIADAAIASDPDARPVLQCADPAPPIAVDHTLVVDLPSDLDPTANPTATTTIAFTTLLPARCPGDAFPLVLHSHGYGGSRITALGPDGALHPEVPHFGSIDRLVAALPFHGYVVLSFDERGHGQSTAANARIIDPAAETLDARALLDWAYDHADDNAILRDDATGIPKDVRVGTIGYSYGGGFQLPLAALDARVDTIVPNGTWHDLLYSLMPGDTVKLSFDGLLCLLATTGGVKNTPLVQTLCNTIGPQGATAQNDRSRGDLAASVASPAAQPRPVSATELTTFLDHHGLAYFERTRVGLPPVSALLLQGNRDVLFDATEAMWNARYLATGGGDVRVLTTEGGHMNPLASQVEGTASCGATQGTVAILVWLDHHLKGIASAAFTAIPKVCISVADTRNAATAPSVGLVAASVPIGEQHGPGAVAAKLASASVSLPIGTLQTFVPVVTIAGAGRVLAGVPTIGSIRVTAGTGALASTNAFVGVGIRRGTTTFLVDDQVTGFAAGVHTRNRNVLEDDRVLLPGVGEQLDDGDVVGVLVMSQHVQFAAVVSTSAAPGTPGVVTYVGGVPVPPITSGLSPIAGLTYVNPVDVAMSDIELPILIPGSFPGATLSTP